MKTSYKSLLLVLFSLFLTKTASTAELCGINLGPEFSKNISTLGTSPEIDEQLKIVIPHVKYYKLNPNNTAALYGDHIMESPDAKHATRELIQDFAPNLVDKIMENQIGSTVISRENKVIVDESSRIELDFSYKLKGDDKIFVEKRAMIYQSPECRIDAIFISTDNNKSDLISKKNHFLKVLHINGAGQLWKIPTNSKLSSKAKIEKETSAAYKTGRSLGKAFVNILILGIIGSIIMFVRRKRKKKVIERNQ